MMHIGEKLRLRREGRQLSLGDLAESTKIQRRYLQAIESGEWDETPGGVFLKGYLRTFAEAVGFDPEKAVAEFQAESGTVPEAESAEAASQAARAVVERLAADQGVSARRSANFGWIAAATATAVVLVVVGFAWFGLGRPTSPQTASAPADAPAVPARDRVTTVPPVPKPAEVQERPSPKSAPIDAVESPVPPATSQPVAVESPPPPEPSPPTERPASEAAAATAQSAGLRVDESGVGTDVVNRTLVGRGDRFREGESVWFWTRIVGGKPGDVIRHVWTHDGTTLSVVELRVGAANWRTQSRRTLTLGAAGRWAVEARDAANRVLAREEFTCVER